MSEIHKITVREVAREAGVSMGTVSRVLSNHTNVHPELRQRVLEAVHKLKYTPLREKKRFSQGAEQTGNIGVLLVGLDSTLSHTPINQDYLQGMERAIAGAERNLLLAEVPSPDRIPAFLKRNQVDGLIVRVGFDRPLLPTARSLLNHILRFPVVWLGENSQGNSGDTVFFDQAAVGRMAAEHLVARGHRRLAFFNALPINTGHGTRGAAFMAQGRALGVQVVELVTPRSDEMRWPIPLFVPQDQVLAMVDQWAALPERQRPTALFVPSDIIAAQVYTALEERGLRVGRDLSLLSCYNNPALLAGLSPPLSSIDAGTTVAGWRAVEQLLWRLENPWAGHWVKLLVEPKLVERSSVVDLRGLDEP